MKSYKDKKNLIDDALDSNLLFSPDELRQSDRSASLSKIIKIASITIIVIVASLGLYYVSAGHNASSNKTANPVLEQVDNTNVQTYTTPEIDSASIDASLAAAKAAQEQADELSAQAQDALDSANALGQQGAANQVYADQLDSNYQSSSQAYQQQQADTQAAIQQQAAKYAQCKIDKEAATAPIAQQIKSTSEEYYNALNALKYAPYSDQPSSEYQRIYAHSQAASQQLSNLRSQLNTTNSSYAC